MDRLDIKIVSYLQEDGVSTNANIARKIDVSEETVRRRLKRLEQDDYVKIVAIPNARKIGYESQVIIGLRASANKVDIVAESLSEMIEISWVAVTTGSFDIFAWATLQSNEALSDFLKNRVGQIEGITSMETFVSLGVNKEEYGLNMKIVTP